MSKTSWQAKAKYNAGAYDNLTVYIPKGLKEPFKAACKAKDESMAAVITRTIEQYLQQNGNK